MFYKLSVGTETDVDLTWTNVEELNIVVFEISGLTTTPFDVHASDENTGQSVSTGTTATTAQNDEICISMASVDTGGNAQNGRDWTQSFTENNWESSGDSGEPGLSVAKKTLSATGTVETTFSTTSAGDEMCGIVAAFKVAGAAGEGPRGPISGPLAGPLGGPF